MHLEDYFEFEKFPTKFGEAERIRIKGHRVSIEHVIEPFKEGRSAEQIQGEMYPTLSLEEVRAAIDYYIARREEVEGYFERCRKIEDAFYQEHLQQEPAPVVKRLRELKAQRRQADSTAHE